MIAKIQKRFTAWMQKRIRARTHQNDKNSVTLDDIYVFPSGFGFVCCFVIISIAVGAINYQVNTVFLLVFLGVALGVLCIWETHKNLKNLSIQCLPIDDVQAGHPVKVFLLIKGQEQVRYGIAFCLEGGEAVKLDRVHKDDEQLILAVPTKHRGHFSLPVIKIYTFFPFGIVRAWSYLFFDRDYFVYPKPESAGHWPEPRDRWHESDQLAMQQGEDDLYELKAVNNPWVQIGRIAWKISARGQGWFLKTMTSPVGENWIFRIEDLAFGDLELNLQQLSYWIYTAEEQGHLYGIELNGELTEINRGSEHMKICLRRLAIY